MSVVEIVKQPCADVIDPLGYDLVEVTYAQEFGIWELTLCIKRKDGTPITHTDCEKVTHAVDEILEALDPTKGENYNLSVASVGIK